MKKLLTAILITGLIAACSTSVEPKEGFEKYLLGQWYVTSQTTADFEGTTTQNNTAAQTDSTYITDDLGSNMTLKVPIDTFYLTFIDSLSSIPWDSLSLYVEDRSTFSLSIKSRGGITEQSELLAYAVEIAISYDICIEKLKPTPDTFPELHLRSWKNGSVSNVYILKTGNIVEVMKELYPYPC